MPFLSAMAVRIFKKAPTTLPHSIRTLSDVSARWTYTCIADVASFFSTLRRSPTMLHRL